MSSSSVLKGLSALTASHLKYFALVRKSQICGDLDGLYYLCFGRHDFFIVDHEMIGCGRGGTLYSCSYSNLERCEADLENQEVFALYFLPNVPLVPQDPALSEIPHDGEFEVPCFPTCVVFQSPDREKLLSEFETYFRTDYMFQHWQIPSSSFVVPVEGGLSLPGMDSGGKLFLTPPTDCKVESLLNYVFFKPKSFEIKSCVNRGGTTTARYVDCTPQQHVFRSRSGGQSGLTQEDFEPDVFEVIIHDKYPLMQTDGVSLTIGGERDPSEVADYFAQLAAAQVVDYRIVGAPQTQKKRSNLSGDLASYNCWKTHLRTSGGRHNTKTSQSYSKKDIIITVIQRKFIPPMMDSFQNIVFIYYGQHRNSTQNTHLLDTMVESFTFNSKTFTCDTLVVQTKANALMLDAESFKWYADNMQVNPSCITLAKMFCQSVLRILTRAGLPFPSGSVFPDLDLKKLGDDPFEYSIRMEEQVPGLSDRKSEKKLVREWKVRVWRYLAYCLDGGLLPGVLDLRKISLYVQQHDRRLAKLGQLLQTLLYFRPVDGDYEQVALPLKISDERLMQSFTFNENVMEKLLSSGYIKSLLDNTTDQLEYPRFIVKLLQRGKDRSRWGYSLQYTVCKQLARSSASLNVRFEGEGKKGKQQQGNFLDKEMKTSPLSDLALHTIVPALVDLLNDETSNDKLQVLVVSTLVNFTKNNAVIKNKVMAGGAVRRICQFLYSKHDDLVRHSCSLLNNCTKSEQYRGQVAKHRAIEGLMRLLERNDFPPFYRSTRILIQACAVIGNLASDTRLRQRITQALGYEVAYTEKFKGERYEQSKSIRVLVDLLQDRRVELTAQRDSLRVTVIFALKNLAIRHEENKRTIGRLAIETLIGILDKTPNEEQNRILLDVTLRCVYVLSFQKNVCKVLQMHHVDKQLQGLQSSFPDITRQIEIKLIKNTA